MRTRPVTDGSTHASTSPGPDDHHRRPTSVAIENTTQSLPPGTTYNLDIALGTDQYQFARIMIIGAAQMSGGGNLWRECAEILATRDSSEAISVSTRDLSFKKVYCATYSKFNGDSYLSHKIFDNNTTITNRYIALQDAVLTGSNLRLTFRNFFGGSATLWVKGRALLW